MRCPKRILAPVALALTCAAVASPCRAHPESIGNWMPYYAAALGLAGKDLPFAGEFVDDFNATVAKPAPLIALGLTGIRAGDEVKLTNHFSGYWSITHTASKRTVKTPLAWNVRFGLRPEPDLPDGDPPDKITGRVIEPAILAQYGFTNARVGNRFVLEYDETAGWLLSLETEGRKVKVPF